LTRTVAYVNQAVESEGILGHQEVSMKIILPCLILFFVLQPARLLADSACSPGTLADYLTLSSCTLGAFTFSNFSGAESAPIVPGPVDISPFTNLRFIGFTVEGPGSDVAYSIDFGFDVSGNNAAIKSAMLDAEPSFGSDQASFTGFVDLSNGVSLHVCQAPHVCDREFDAEPFPPIQNFSVATNGSVDPGPSPEGPSAVGYSLSFQPVPEPGTLLLLGSGLLALCRGRNQQMRH
jgi:PEP-CTERM motif